MDNQNPTTNPTACECGARATHTLVRTSVCASCFEAGYSVATFVELKEAAAEWHRAIERIPFAGSGSTPTPAEYDAEGAALARLEAAARDYARAREGVTYTIPTSGPNAEHAKAVPPAPPLFCHDCGATDRVTEIPFDDGGPLCARCCDTPIDRRGDKSRRAEPNVTLGGMDWFVGLRLTGPALNDPGGPPKVEIEEAYPFGWVSWGDLAPLMSDDYKAAILAELADTIHDMQSEARGPR